MPLGLIVIFAASISAQVLSVGAMGGLPLTDAIAANASQNIPGPIIPSLPSFGACVQCVIERTVPYVIGPAVEARIKGAFSLNVGALYSRVDYDRSSGNSFVVGNIAPVIIANFTAAKHVIDRWELPILLKYSMRTGDQLRPFVESGISVQYNRERQVAGLAGSASGLSFEPLNISLMPVQSSVVNSSMIEGVTAGIGVSYGSHKVRPSLEFRYTRWFDKAFDKAFTGDSNVGTIPPTPAPHLAYSVLNQAQVLLGIMF